MELLEWTGGTLDEAERSELMLLLVEFLARQISEEAIS
jgi:hypothetical protein